MAQYFITLYLLLPISFLPGFKKRNVTDHISSDTSTELRGLGMALIVLAHAVGNNSNTATFFFYVSAILGVGACFLLSGYGLYKSYHTKEGYMDHFLIPKFSRVLIPYLILLVVDHVITAVLTGSFQIRSLFIELLSLKINTHLLWYIKVQLLLYLFFYVGFRFLDEKKAILCVFVLTALFIAIAIIAGLQIYWYNTCLFFPLGIILAKFDRKLIPLIVSWKGIILSSLSFVFVFLVIFFFGRMQIELLIDTFYILSFLSLMVGLFSRWGGSFVLTLMGKLSMELYLVHVLFIGRNPWNLYSPQKVWTYLLLLSVSIILCIPIYQFNHAIMNKSHR